MSARRQSRHGQSLGLRKLSMHSTSSHRFKKTNKRDGTPEKSNTPSQDDTGENRPPSRHYIWSEEIEKLKITDEELQKLRDVKPKLASPRKSPVSTSFTVRKLKPVSEWEPKTRLLTIAKPAPPNAPLQPVDTSGYAGPRYNLDGSVIPYSILGSYNDFHREAIKKGDMMDLPSPGREDMTQSPTLKYEKKKKSVPDKYQPLSNESNALRNWQQRMMERKKQQGYISKLLQKNPEDLAMNQADNYRGIQEQRHLIDRTISTMDYGKGRRVGSEFWNQEERIGTEMSGIHISLTQTEKGYPPPVEHIGIPGQVRQERGMTWPVNYTSPVRYPWHKAKYYDERRKQLQNVINELDEHQPDFAKLQVIGQSDPYTKISDVTTNTRLTDKSQEDRDSGLEDDLKEEYQQDSAGGSPGPVYGPSLQIAGQPARWTGDSYSFKGQIGIVARISFEAYTGERIMSHLEVVNDGTTSIYFDWKQLPKENPFDLTQLSVQRFYFNNSSGVILPGEVVKFPFVFKSHNAGVFTEQWKFETRPVVCAGADIIVIMRGVALQEDKYQQDRQDIERELHHKEAEEVVKQLLDDILSSIRTPDRPRSPLDAYLTEEDIFCRHNKGLLYNFEVVENLKLLYLEIFPEEERDGKFWDLCVQDLKDVIMEIDDEEGDERRDKFIQTLNEAVCKLTFRPNCPIQQQLTNICYEYLASFVDAIVGQSMLIRQMMGLPEHDGDEYLEGDLPKISSTKIEVKPKERKKRLADSRKGKSLERSKSEKEKKVSPGKEAKAPKGGKETPKLDPKKAAPVTSKKSPLRGASSPAGLEREKTSMSITEPIVTTPPPPENDPILEKKYKEKLYCQTRSLLSDVLDKMEDAFQNVLNPTGNILRK